MYAIRRLRASADIFRTVVILKRTSALFVAKNNIEFFKIYSVFTSDMDRGGRGIEPVLTFFGQGLHFLPGMEKNGRLTFFWTIFYDFGRHHLWIDPEQKHSKVKHGLVVTNWGG